MENLKKLSRSEMKNVKGGGTCCWHETDWSASQCGLSIDQAQATAGYAGVMWCCDSCTKSRDEAVNP